jgi:hypothetical protein
MEDRNLDLRPYFELIHSLLREDGSDEEITRTNRVMDWVLKNLPTINRVHEKDEMNLIGIIREHWREHGMCPSRNISDILARRKDKPQVLLDLLEGYDEHLPHLRKYTHADMDVVLGQRIQDYEQIRLTRILDQASNILVGGVPHPDSYTHKGKDLPPLRGTRDALNYLRDKFQKGILVNEVPAAGGQLSEYEDRIDHLMIQPMIDRKNGQLTIPTGIPLIDDHMGGLRRKEMTGVLGYVGQRKSAVVRTMAYNAAAAGYRVLHIPVETDFDEELLIYCIFHAHVLAAKKGRQSTITLRSLQNGLLSKTQAEELITAKKDFVRTVGCNLLVRDLGDDRSWTAAKSMIDSECLSQAIDVVVVDYLTLLNNAAPRDLIIEMTKIIQDAKQVALKANNGKGLAFLTPIQGNRSGLDYAAANDGAWDVTGVSTYSELDKSLDNCLYVYLTDEIAANRQIRVGSCKHRRGANIPSTLVPFNLSAGMLEGEVVVEEMSYAPNHAPRTLDGKVFPWMEPK